METKEPKQTTKYKKFNKIILTDDDLILRNDFYKMITNFICSIGSFF